VAGTAAAVWCTYRLIATWRWRWAAATGAACAVAMLSRSELALLVPVMVVPAVLFARTVPMSQRLAHAALACAIAAFVVAPWVVYNLGRFEEPVVLSHGDGNVLAGSNCDATYHGTLLGFHNGFCGFIEDLPAENSLEAAARRRAAFDYIGDHLERLPVVVAARVGRVWGAYGQVQMARIAQAEGRPVVASLAGLAMFWALVPLAVLGALRLRRAGQPLWPLVAPIVIVTFNAAAFYGLTRFRVPAEVSLVVLAAVAIARLRSAGGQQSPDMLSRPAPHAGQAPHWTSSTST
jgi:4-amino-4-deoxy-L-arabinose transferase-like glycosyltransferase